MDKWWDVQLPLVSQCKTFISEIEVIQQYEQYDKPIEQNIESNCIFSRNTFMNSL